MPGTHRLPLMLAFLFVLAALSGCGSDEISGEIPPDDAATLKDALEGVRSELEASDCDAAALQADQFIDEVNLLPLEPAGEELKTELRNAGVNLRTLVDNQCAVTEPPQTTQDTTTDPTTTDTTTSTTDPTTTDTTTTDTTTTDTSTDEQPPPGNGDGGGPPGDGGGTDGGTGGTGGGGTGDETGD